MHRPVLNAKHDFFILHLYVALAIFKDERIVGTIVGIFRPAPKGTSSSDFYTSAEQVADTAILF